MQTSTDFIKRTGQLTLLSGVIALICNVLISLAINFNFEVFTNPALIFEGLQMPQTSYFRWSMITDVWGYYLLLVPTVFLLFEKMETPWRKVYAAGGLAYCFMGAIGAAILAATGTHFLREYLGADPAGQAAAKSSFLFVFHIVNNGIWNLLEMGLFGIFLLGAAPVLREKGKLLYWLTILLGISGILDMVGNTFEVPVLGEIGLNFYLLFEPIWAIWLGVIWMRKKQ